MWHNERGPTSLQATNVDYSGNAMKCVVVIQTMKMYLI